MKLLYITPKISNSGGVARILSVKLNYLVEVCNFDVVLLVTNDPERRMFYEFNEKISINYFSKSNNLGYLKDYRDFIISNVNTQKPNVVLVLDNGLKGGLIPIWIKGLPIIYERHSSKLELKYTSGSVLKKIRGFFTYNLINNLARKFSLIVVLNESMKNEWKHRNIEVIPNPLWFDPKSLKMVEKKKKVIFVGRQTKQKGVDLLLEIWKKLHPKNPEWEMDIYGEPTSEFNLQSNDKLNLNVKSPTKNIHEIYSDASLLFLTSRNEGFGMVLIEAMAYKIPCVAFNCPVGPSHIINEGENGFLIDAFNIDEFVTKAGKLMKDQTMNYSMGKNAQISVEKYQLKNVMEQWISIFNSITSA